MRGRQRAARYDSLAGPRCQESGSEILLKTPGDLEPGFRIASRHAGHEGGTVWRYTAYQLLPFSRFRGMDAQQPKEAAPRLGETHGRVPAKALQYGGDIGGRYRQACTVFPAISRVFTLLRLPRPAPTTAPFC